jgi:membrane protease YdiL (CAAX protease family)
VIPNRSPGGSLSLVVVAIVLGLLWGWVPYQTGSIVWVAVSHTLFGFSGLGGRVYVE